MSIGRRASRIWALVAKEFRQFFRDPVLLILVAWLYTVEVIICAVSLTFDLHELPIAVVDLDRSVQSAELTERLSVSPSFAVRSFSGDPAAARALLQSGRVQLTVTIPAGYGENTLRATSAPVQLLADGTNSITAMTAIGDMTRLVNALALQRAAGTGTGRPLPKVWNQVRVWYNPGLRFVHFVVISMIALAAFMVGVIHPAASLVKEKESGTIEHLLVSPVGTLELLVAKGLPTLVVGLLALVPALVVARAFGVPFRGSLPGFLLLSAVFLVSSVAIGIVIATAVRTLQQALLVAFFVLFPVMFLSGTMTPIESMPRALQIGSLLSPLRYYVEGLLAIFLRGAGITSLSTSLLRMGALGMVSIAISAVLLRRRLT